MLTVRNIVFSAFYYLALASCLSSNAIIVRKYNPAKDYQAAHAICTQHWREFDEDDAVCSGTFETLLLHMTPFSLLPQDAEGLGIKVLADKGKVLGILIHSHPVVASTLLIEQGIHEDPTYAELSYIGVDASEQRKGLGVQLFNSWKQELIKDGQVQTILSRVKPSNAIGRAWHLKQGFTPIGHGEARNIFEEGARQEAEAYGQMLFKLDLQKREVEDWSSSKNFFRSNQPRVSQMADQNRIGGLAQARLGQKVADRTEALIPDLTHDQRAYFVRFYLKSSLNRSAVRKIFTYILGKTKANQAKKSLEKLFDYVDRHLPALESEITHDPEVLEFLAQAGRTLEL